MLKVLDLFSGTQSVRKALEKTSLNFDYKGVDIYPPNILLDMTQDNIVEKLKEKLGDWTPDFIWASPVCLSFSRALGIKNGTLAWEFKPTNRFNGRWIEKDIEVRQNFNYITHGRFKTVVDNPSWQKRQQQKGEDGRKMIENTKTIINYYGVPFAVENPAYALSQHLLKCYFKNIADYCMYGFEWKKSTGIYSDRLLHLYRCRHKNQHKYSMAYESKCVERNQIWLQGNKTRSQVPPLLIKTIIEQTLKLPR